MNTDEILFRPHYLNEILGYERGTELTPTMEANLAKFKAKLAEGGELTPNQQKDYDNWLSREINGPELSKTCKKRLVKIFREITSGRYYTHNNKYTEKGIRQENDAITLYSLLKGKFYKKNTQRLRNEFFDGEWDLDDPEEKKTIDIKCSWSLETFPHPASHDIEPQYEDQGYGYADLKKYSKHVVAYCLVNAPGDLILNEKKKVWYEWGMPDDYDTKWVEMRKQIERNMIFDMNLFIKQNPGFDLDTPISEWEYDIPMEERVVEYEVNINDEKMTEIKNQIIKCRKWIKENLMKSTIKQLEAA